jgi:hypothetical protein
MQVNRWSSAAFVAPLLFPRGVVRAPSKQAVSNPPALYLVFSFANASLTRGAKGESGASFKYFSYSFAISSS